MLVDLKNSTNGSGGGTGGDTPTPTPETYTLTFYPNTDYEVEGSVQEPYTQTFTEDVAQSLTLNSFLNEAGNFFYGWSTDSSSSASVEYTDGQELTLLADLSLYAVWADGYFVSGTVNETLSLSSVVGSSFVLTGVTGNTSDIITPTISDDSGDTPVYESKTVITVSTTTPLTIKKLCITGGTGSCATGEGLWGSVCGGGVYLSSGSDVTLGTGALVTDNTSTKCGGGIYVNSSTLTVDGGSVTENSVSDVVDQYQGGAGIFIYNSTVTINSGSVSSNVITVSTSPHCTVYSGGAGIYLRNSNSTSTLTINGGSISSNIVKSYGSNGVRGVELLQQVLVLPSF